MIRQPARKPKKTPLKKVVIGLIIVLVLVAAYGVFHHFTTDAIKTTTSGVKLAPPTKQEQASGDEQKDTIVNQTKDGQANPSPTATTATGKKVVTPIISYAGSDRLNAYVGGVLEDGGTCTATYTQAGQATIVRTSTGFSNVSYTQCAPITPNLPAAGTWSVVVQYSSTSAEGTSQAQTF